ncbi:DUF6252 family protein [Flavobacterium sp.]|uniref:DUF6252 family protein n=1 Tax=Flavobacterium sp. TaxID=239 RepID=UPI0040481DF5
MKKIVIVLLGMFLLTSCVNETEDNTPTIQAKFNNVNWKAKETNVSVDASGSLVIKAYRGSEVLVLKTSSPTVGTYVLGTSSITSMGTYSVGSALNVIEYNTRVVPGPVFRYIEIATGTGYSNTNSAQALGGSGSGFVLKVTTDSSTGSIATHEVKARGSNYVAGDNVILDGGDGNARFRVLNVQQSNGVVVIDKVENGTITGTFQLNAVNDSGDVVTFSEGVFYKVPMN